MSLPCLHGVLHVPQEVQNCHTLVQVTSEVSDTPLSQPLTAVMQSPRPMARQYILLIRTYIHTYIRTPQTAIVRKWCCLYIRTD